MVILCTLFGMRFRIQKAPHFSFTKPIVSRFFFVAALHCIPASRCIWTAVFCILRMISRFLQDQSFLSGCFLRIKRQHCPQQFFCIRMPRLLVNLRSQSLLYHTSKIHNSHPLADPSDYLQIMGNKQIGQLCLSLNLFQKLQKLRLRKDVLRRKRFVTD